MENNHVCKYCKKIFKKEIYLIKHQKNAKYCVIIQKKIAEKEVEKSIKNLQTVKEEINIEISDLLNLNGDLITNNSEELENKKIDEIHSMYLIFENDKIQIENEYNLQVYTLLDKGNIKHNLEEYYTIEKIKISKLQNIYSEFENKKSEIQKKYDSIILEEKLYEEEEKFKDKKDTWKEAFKNVEIKKLEVTFEKIKNEIIRLVDDVNDIENIDKIFNNKIFKINNFLEFDDDDDDDISSKNIIKTIDINYDVSDNSSENSKNIKDNSQVFDNSSINTKKKKKIKRENEETENKLLYHLILLLQDQKINNETLMYIVVELMKFMNNYQIKGKDKKNSILFILKNFINTNNNDINNKEDILIFVDKFLNEFVNIISAIGDKKIRIKQKNNCFLPLCF